jgi:hypothetical protein
MPDTFNPLAKSGDGSLENVGLKLDAPVQCDCCRQRFMDHKSLALHKKFIYDPNRADSKLEE